MMKSVAAFDWDDGNWPKCGKHGVSKEEIETLFRDGPDIYADPHHSIEEQRLRAIGRTRAGKWLLIAFTLRERDGQTLIRPVSARYMHKKEIDHYERQKEET
jgi:uncharacterized protein